MLEEQTTGFETLSDHGKNDLEIDINKAWERCEHTLNTYKTGEANNLSELSSRIYFANRAVGWWSVEDELDARFKPNGKFSKETANLIAAKLALCHSELSEALEGMRKGLMDDHLPKREMCEVELGDTIIRILDLCGFLGYDIGAAVEEKLQYNANRADHKLANREAAGGKTI